MAGNQFGTLFKISTFGESHGVAMGVVIDGCPAGIAFEPDWIQRELQRRKPGQSDISSPRQEPEAFEVLSGVFEGKTLGTPIAILIRNQDARSADYDSLKSVYRPGHADFTWQEKYGMRDYRGGGRQSARETVARVIAGTVARMYLAQLNIYLYAYVDQIQELKVEKPYHLLDLTQIEKNAMRCPDPDMAERMLERIRQIQSEGDSVGGIIRCVCQNMPVGLGEPVFDKLHAELGKAILSINACKGFDIGSGFDSIHLTGSQHNDAWTEEEGNIRTKTNHAGGVLGGISNGMDLVFRAAFKPVSSIRKEQQLMHMHGEMTNATIPGRHDPCVLPRAVPIVEAMTALVLADMCLRQKIARV